MDNWDVAIYGRITSKIRYLEEYDNYAVLIKADETNSLYTHYSCPEAVATSIVEVARLLSEALQDGKNKAGQDRVSYDVEHLGGDSWQVCILVDNKTPIFCTSETRELMKDEVVGLVQRMAAVLQNLGGYSWRDEL